MKTLRISILSTLFLFFAQLSFAQTKSETFKVSGECGMCKGKIEGAAKKAGASFASWSEDTKVLTVKYSSTSSNTAKIKQAIAATGYDTPGYKATDEAYEKLHACCKYDRAESNATAAKSCCDHASCVKAECTKNGICSKDAACCKEAGCDTKDCCKKS